jgi:hypothetical protein
MAKRVPVDQHEKFVPEKKGGRGNAQRECTESSNDKSTVMDVPPKYKRHGGVEGHAIAESVTREVRESMTMARLQTDRSKSPAGDSKPVLMPGPCLTKMAPTPLPVPVSTLQAARDMRTTGATSKENPTPAWKGPRPCFNCGKIVVGHHGCRPCERARKSDNPEKALAEVRRKRKAGLIHKGYPKGRLRRRVG